MHGQNHFKFTCLILRVQLVLLVHGLKYVLVVHCLCQTAVNEFLIVGGGGQETNKKLTTVLFWVIT